MNEENKLDINKYASLSMLSLSKESENSLKEKVFNLFSVAENISTLNTTDKEEKSIPVSLSSLRDDNPRDSLSQKDSVFNSKETNKGFIFIPSNTVKQNGENENA